jgi:hypothetical protein
MMTGIPPPRYYDYDWQVSRMNDKGFSKGLRDIVAKMLHPIIGKRPDALDLVGLVQYEWRAWRANTIEGRAYVDRGDALVKSRFERGKGGEVAYWAVP